MREVKLFLVQQVHYEDGVVEDSKVFSDYKMAVQYFNSLIGQFFLSCVFDSEYSCNEETSCEGYSGFRDVAGFLADIYTRGCCIVTNSSGSLSPQPPGEEKDFDGHFEFGTEHWSIQLTKVEGLI